MYVYAFFVSFIQISIIYTRCGTPTGNYLNLSFLIKTLQTFIEVLITRTGWHISPPFWLEYWRSLRKWVNNIRIYHYSHLLVYWDSQIIDFENWRLKGTKLPCSYTAVMVGTGPPNSPHYQWCFLIHTIERSKVSGSLPQNISRRLPIFWDGSRLYSK